MSYNQKQNAGRGNMPKTGRDIPLNMKSPVYMTDPDPKTGEAKVGEVPGYEEIKERFKGKYTVSPKKGKVNEYTLSDKSGNTVSYRAGAVVEDKKKEVVDILNASMKKK